MSDPRHSPSASSATSAKESAEERPSKADLVVSTVKSQAVLFHDERGRCFASVFDARGSRNTFPLRSGQFGRWLDHELYRTTGKVVPVAPKKDAISSLEAIARHGDGSRTHGQERRIWLRTAAHEASVYLDIGDANRTVIEIGPEGWSTTTDPSVAFVRPDSMTALALPERGGDLAQLRQFINIATDDDYLLLVAWLVAALRPAGPYPILTFVSEQGSGKSTACAFVRQLVDPSVAPLRSLPRSERDLAISASNSWLLAYDNVSGISAPMSDALCRLSTGGGFSCRALYSDADEVIFEAQRPILLNGIDDIGVRPDLGERCLLLSLEPIADNARKEEQRLRADFAAALPGLLGALLTVAQRAFVVAPLVRLASRPRMADFATLGAAVAVALGRPEASFLEAYMRNALCITGAALDAHPVAHAVIALMEGASHWKGTPTELYGLFKRGASEDARRSEQWPHGVNAMGDALRRLAPELRKIGIDVRSHRGRQRSWEITKLPTPSTSSSTPSTPSTSDGTEESAVDDDDDLDGPPMEVARDFDL